MKIKADRNKLKKRSLVKESLGRGKSSFSSLGGYFQSKDLGLIDFTSWGELLNHYLQRNWKGKSEKETNDEKINKEILNGKTTAFVITKQNTESDLKSSRAKGKRKERKSGAIVEAFGKKILKGC